MFNKKGVSTVVATVALILLTFVAAAIIINFMVPFVQNNLESGSECVPYRDYFTFEDDFGYACFNSTNSQYLISVRTANTEDEVESKVVGFRLAFLKSGESKVVDVTENASVTQEIKMLNPSALFLTIPRGGEVRTFAYNTTQNFDSVEVAPKLDNGRFCDVTDDIELEDICS